MQDFRNCGQCKNLWTFLDYSKIFSYPIKTWQRVFIPHENVAKYFGTPLVSLLPGTRHQKWPVPYLSKFLRAITFSTDNYLWGWNSHRWWQRIHNYVPQCIICITVCQAFCRFLSQMTFETFQSTFLRTFQKNYFRGERKVLKIK